MADKIYKYFSHDVLTIIFDRPGFLGVKCSLPKDYNDPYELFLGTDLSMPTPHLAMYQDIIQELPQLPTTCFSTSPVVTPMWAHYANNHTGFVVEFDISNIATAFEHLALNNIQYKDRPNDTIARAVEFAVGRGKPRDALRLQQTVFHESYFSKQSIWKYEQEYRLVDLGNNVEEVHGKDILFLPHDCVSAIIVGKNFSTDLLEQSQQLAEESGLSWYESIVGTSTTAPYFKDNDNNVFVFEEGRISTAKAHCNSCSEPIDNLEGTCAWCAISEDQTLAAASSNPFRILGQHGLLDEYYDRASNMGKSRQHDIGSSERSLKPPSDQ